jgi:hypothetical protein
MTTVWIYEEGGTLKDLTSEEAAHAWLKQDDPEGIVEYDVRYPQPASRADRRGEPGAKE